MRVRLGALRNYLFLAHLTVNLVNVEALWGGVDLYHDWLLRRCFEDRIEIQLVGDVAGSAVPSGGQWL